MTLLEDAKAGDNGAWDLMVRIYTPLVYRRCRTLNLSRDDASDVAQEVFLKLFNGLSKFEARANGGFRNWLRTITRHEVSNWFRTRANELDAVGGTAAMLRCLDFPAVVTDDSLLSSVKPNETQQALREALGRIRPEFSERDWMLFVRTQVDGLSDKQVAEELRISHGAARTALSRIRMRLKELIGDTEDPDIESDSQSDSQRDSEPA